MTEELAVSPWDETQQGDSARAGEPPVLVCETTTEGEESMKGIITEIERFALKDGPGIRTTVFFKGCNMACKWCHNPETLSVRPQLMIYPDKCIGCGACVEACRAGARTLGKNGACSTIAPPASTAEPAPRTASPVLSSCPERR